MQSHACLLGVIGTPCSPSPSLNNSCDIVGVCRDLLPTTSMKARDPAACSWREAIRQQPEGKYARIAARSPPSPHSAGMRALCVFCRRACFTSVWDEVADFEPSTAGRRVDCAGTDLPGRRLDVRHLMPTPCAAACLLATSALRIAGWPWVKIRLRSAQLPLLGSGFRRTQQTFPEFASCRMLKLCCGSAGRTGGALKMTWRQTATQRLLGEGCAAQCQVRHATMHSSTAQRRC